MSIERPGIYVVATPIGNLADLTLRAAAVLGAVDFVLSEDTRHSRRLLDHYRITTPLIALHEHNEHAASEGVLRRLSEQRQACALISDAGTPLISDPGFILVRGALAAGVPVFAVPGPCAAIAALSICGLPAERFAFEGFLPAQAGARARRLRELSAEARTLVFYEAPHRIAATLEAMAEAFGGARAAALGRELTKRFETLYRGSLATLRQRLREDPDASRGELVIVVAGAAAAATAETAEIERLLGTVLELTDRKTAVRIVAALTGAGRNRVYAAALRQRPGEGIEI